MEAEILVELELARDLLMERTFGNPARSPNHNARLVLDRVIARHTEVTDRATGKTVPGEATKALNLDLDLHHSTAVLVNQFALALAQKLAEAERKYGYTNGWISEDWQEDLVRRLQEHVDKGDPRDVAAFCAFAWFHRWSVSSAPDATWRAAIGDDNPAPASEVDVIYSDGSPTTDLSDSIDWTAVRFWRVHDVDGGHCLACRRWFKADDLVLPDVSGDWLHAACCGPERESYVKDVGTGEPLGPDDRIPTGVRWDSLASAKPSGEADQ